MAYNKQNWADGQTITAAKLNAMDDGIGKSVQDNLDPANYLMKINTPTIVNDAPSSNTAFSGSFKNAQKNSTYFIDSNTAVRGTIDDYPQNGQAGQTLDMLETIGSSASGEPVQILYEMTDSGDTEMWFRAHYGEDWTDWVKIGDSTNQARSYIVNDGDNLMAVIKEAVTHENSRVYVNTGTYDLIAEYKEVYGDPENFGSSVTSEGMSLGNGITVICAPNANIVADYTGSNAQFQKTFSAINAGTGSFTLIGANIRTKNCRYAIHDERSGLADPYYHKYINCHVEHDKGTGAGYTRALGGGLGAGGNVEIRGCVFKSIGTPDGNIVSYHNAIVNGARSQVFIHGNYIYGTVQVSQYGKSTAVTDAIVCGNRLTREPVLIKETGDDGNSDIANMNLMAFGNTIEASE